MIGAFNVIELATFPAFGTWSTTLPLANLQNRTQGIVARSTAATTASTKFRMTFSAARVVRIIALCNHNLSSAATVTIKAYSDSGYTTQVYTSGAVSAWPTSYTAAGKTGWDDPSPSDRAYTTLEKEYMNWTHIQILSPAQEQQYFQVEINDTGNADGYVQIGRVFIGQAWQPTHNFDFGVSIKHEDTSIIQEAIDGTEYFYRKYPTRVARFGLNHLNEEEAYQSAYEILRKSGNSGEVLFIYDSADTTHKLRRSFIGRMKELSAIENINYGLFGSTFEIKELL